jgi:hypothetical protein
MEERKINVSVSEGMEFFAHEFSVNFNPLQFIFDFKTITPRVDMRSKDVASLLIRHNIVLTDPYHAKKIHELLGNVIERYEKQFGKIEKPKALEKYEKNNKKKKTEESKNNKTIAPNYLG